MRVFFGTLMVLISQMSYDIYDWFHDFFVVLWENLYDVFKRMVIFVGVVVTILFDAWIFWMLFNWAEHPLVITSIFTGTILIIMLQLMAWLGRVYYYECLLDKWKRASQTYQRGREL
jgi:hypothetical protein